nr:very short patch repair endonuclease [Geodermatophilus sp. TF02-6]
MGAPRTCGEAWLDDPRERQWPCRVPGVVTAVPAGVVTAVPAGVVTAVPAGVVTAVPAVSPTAARRAWPSAHRFDPPGPLVLSVVVAGQPGLSAQVVAVEHRRRRAPSPSRTVTVENRRIEPCSSVRRGVRGAGERGRGGGVAEDGREQAAAGPGPAPPPSSDAVARRFRRQPWRDTAYELAVRRRLHARGVRYRVDVRPCAQTRARGDLVWKGRRLVVFLDGCFWHGCPSCGHVPHVNRAWWVAKLAGNVARDRRADAVLRAAGWRVLRLWEHEDPDTVVEAICSALGRRPAGG